VVKTAFAQRRKTLANNLAHGLGLTRSALADLERESGIALSRRAETLPVEEFARVAALLTILRGASMSNVKCQMSNGK
jgi:16S rRNA (adenine1518-N6/adenine1519-N6)-dimethyltransferase